MFDLFWSHGIVKRAIENNLISTQAVNIRDFAIGKHRSTDDRPYGGGCGMVMTPEPLSAAIKSVKKEKPAAKTIFLTPQGQVFNQNIACELASAKDLVMVCGRYEGVDERICDTLIDFEISIGDYVLTGGELPAMIIMDAITRLLPDALGGADSAEKDSFSDTLLEHAHYTRPRNFEGIDVPKVLLSGNHKEIDQWRLKSSLIRTFLKRPDLFEKRKLDSKETDVLKKWCLDIEKIILRQSLYGADALSGS